MTNQDRITFLLDRMLKDIATPEELSELAEAVKEEKDGMVTNQVQAFLEKNIEATVVLPGKERCDEMVNTILAADKLPESQASRPASIFYISRKVAAAVVFFLVAGFAIYWLVTKQSNGPTNKTVASTQQNDKAPGDNKATLTLSDGSIIVLDSVANGAISQQGNTKVLKLNDGQLAYNQDTSGAFHSSEIPYNTVSIPRGGQYQVILPDGTKVWLNAASSLRFPAIFTGKQRNVELNGEGYFEVAKNAAMPFHVKVNDMSIQVLGTHFNVMAYSEENVAKTTLLEGVVKVASGNNNSLLKPGQQAILKSNSNNIQIEEADVDEAIAWKNGYFQFNKIDASSMRQLSRWYDIDVVYEVSIKENEFKGKIDRNIKLTSVVEALKISGIHCRIEKNKLIVMP